MRTGAQGSPALLAACETGAKGWSGVPIAAFKDPADAGSVICWADGDVPKSPPPGPNGTLYPDYNRVVFKTTLDGRHFILTDAGYRDSLPIKGPTTPVAPATPPTTLPPQPPALGRTWGAGSQRGYGEVRPSSIFNGGDPTGIIENVHWQSWGQDHATGSGFAYYEAPGKTVAESTRQSAAVVAFHLATCNGIRAYTAVEWYFPQHGQQFDPNSYINICTGQHVGSP